MESSVGIDNDFRKSSKLPSQKKPTTGGWNAAIFIIFVEMAERFAFYGLAGNLITYLTNDLGEPVSTAAKNGMVLLTLSVSVIPRHYREAVFFTALYVLAIGEGGHKPCVQTFAADQFDENNPHEKAAKSSFFNWWFAGIVTGASIAIVVVIYLQDNVSWAAGFGVLSVSLVAALAVFLAVIKRYRKQGPTGSPFTMLAQVFVAAAKKRRVS
ncbi:hypothetical protein V6N13_091565 [Hibiscus sabdariffa]